jgi:hypothetical protein
MRTIQTEGVMRLVEHRLGGCSQGVKLLQLTLASSERGLNLSQLGRNHDGSTGFPGRAMVALAELSEQAGHTMQLGVAPRLLQPVLGEPQPDGLGIDVMGRAPVSPHASLAPLARAGTGDATEGRRPNEALPSRLSLAPMPAPVMVSWPRTP